ncbi:MAG: DUF2851 family protein [Bacteroidia bacterium]
MKEEHKPRPSRWQISELLLHWIWKHRLYEPGALSTLEGYSVEVLEVGHPQSQGPDFQSVQVRMNGIVWIGTVEIDTTPDLWYVHKHSENPAYCSTILHVVWKASPPATTVDANGRAIPILPLAPAVREDILQQLYPGRRSFACASLARSIPESEWLNLYESWGEKRLLKRHQGYRSERELFEAFWQTLLYSLGSPDGQSFQQIAKSLPWSVFSRSAETLIQKEAALFGMAGLLENLPKAQSPYEHELLETWHYLRKKHSWTPLQLRFRLARPAASPWRRLAQAAALIHAYPLPVSLLLHPPASLPTPSPYWCEHWAWQKPSARPLHAASPLLYQNVLINALYPFGIYYLRYTGQIELALDIVEKFRRLPPENHTYARTYATYAYPARNAWQTQGQVQLWREACQPQACLSCPIGKAILGRQ